MANKSGASSKGVSAAGQSGKVAGVATPALDAVFPAEAFMGQPGASPNGAHAVAPAAAVSLTATGVEIATTPQMLVKHAHHKDAKHHAKHHDSYIDGTAPNADDGVTAGLVAQGAQAQPPADPKQDTHTPPPEDGSGGSGASTLIIVGGVLGAGLIAAAAGSGGHSSTPAAPSNQPPVGVADSYTTAEDTTLTIAAAGVLANDTDADGNALHAVLVAGPAHGTLTLNANGSFVYTPTANYNGADSFTYKPNDGTADGNTVTVSLTVTPVNDAPVGVADSYTTAEDTTLTIAAAGVLANDTDVDGDTLHAVLVAGPAHGTLTLNANGSFVYTPSANYNGADSFTYKPNDGTADGNTVTVSLTVTPVNDAPVGVADSYTTAEDTTLTIAAAGVLANDTDVDGDTLHAVLVAGPTHGTLTLNANGSFVYTPSANYNGADSFTYKPNDGTTDGNTVTVSLTVTPVNDAPVGIADSYTTAEDTTLTIAAAGVLANDTDVEGSALSAILVTGPAHGTLTLNADGSFVYTPSANYNGADSFTYKPNDGTADGNTVTVSLTVTPVNDAPVAVADSYTTNEDTTLTIAAAGVLTNDTDVDGDTLHAVLVSGPAHGALTLNADGSFVYTPSANYNGADSFTYKPNDGTADGNTVTVSLTVTPVNDAPVGVADSYTTAEDTTLTIAAAGVLANDTDVEGSALSAILVSGPAHGSLTLNADGSFSYTPSANYNGADSFTYKPNDGTADGNTVTVSLTVTPVNDAPVGVADSYTTAEDTTLTIAAAGVLANDTDVDGDTLHAVLVSGPAHGSLTFNANGSFSYTPTANYNGADSFTYKPNDGTTDGNTVTVSLTVTPVNDAPVGVADSYTTNEDTTLTIAAAGVLANDTDVDGDTLHAVLVAGPAHGALTLNADGSFVYTPSANYNGADSFTYKPNDGTADGNTVTVSLTVTPVNDAPVAVADSYTTNEDTTLTIAAAGVLANDSDVDGNALSAILVTGPAHGSLTFNADGSFSYTPTANYNGADSFTYKPNDGTTDGNTVTVSLNVTPVNDAPIGVADSYALVSDTTLTVAAAGVLTNDTDIDGDVLSAVLLTGPAHGALTLNADGSFSYTPVAGYSGGDSFTYKPNDGTADGNTVTVSLTVNPANVPPVGVADSYTTAEDTTLTIAAAGVLTNDSDADGNALSAVLVSGPAHGSLTLNADGSFSYTPSANYNGADSFTYKPNDGIADGNTVTVSLTVTPVNDAPVGVADSYTTNEDTTLTVAAAGVLANDSDVDGNALTAVLVTGPSHGALTLNADGSFSYTPSANYNGSDSFTYKPNDGTTNGNVVTVALTVTPVNDAPVGVADNYTTNEDTTLTIAAAGVLANDTDVEGSALSAVLVTGPAHGTLTLNANGSFVYTPTANYNGADSFTYKPNDGTADGNTVTVSLTVTPVNDAPVGVADSYTTAEDTTLTIAAAGVLANDTDVDGDTLHAVLVSGPAHGSLTFNANGSFSYTPTANYNGADSFTYKPNDGTADGNTVTVSLTVTPVNDAPVGVADSYTTNEDTTLTIAAAGVLANDTDVDGDTLHAVLVAGPAHGSLTLNADGSFNYTPSANYNGADSFTYKPNDGTADGNTVTVSLTVTPVNDAPVVTAGNTLGYTENAAATAISSGLTLSDVDSATLSSASVAITSNYANGQDVLAYTTTTKFTGTFNAATGVLSLTLNGGQSATLADWQGALEAVTYRNTSEDPSTLARTVTFTANDGGAVNNLGSATATINVTAVNDAPVVVAGNTLGYTENGAATAVSSGLTLSDVDSPTLSSASVGITTNFVSGQDVLGFTDTAKFHGSFDSGTGVLSLSLIGGQTATLADWQGALRSVTYNNTSDAPSTLARTVTFTADDGAAAQHIGTATATVNVTAVNDAPTAAVPADASIGTAFSHTNLAIAGLSVGDIDAGSGNVTATVTSGNAGLTFTTTGLSSSTGNGTHTVTLTGTVAQVNTALATLLYNSDDGYVGSDSVTLSVNDNGNTGTGGALGSGGSTFHVGVVPQVFIIDNSAGGTGGTGTAADPFRTIADFNASSATGTGDYVYLRNGTGTYSEADGINLKASEHLVGQGDTLQFTNPVTGAVVTIGFAGSTPTISVTGANQHGIDLSTDNNVAGLNVATTLGNQIGINDNGAAVGALTIADMNVTGIGQAVNIAHGGTLNVAIGTLNSTGSTAQGVQLSGTSAVAGANFLSGTFTVSNGAISNSASQGFRVGDGTAGHGGTIAVSDGGTIGKTTAGNVVDVEGHTAGAVTFSGAIAASGAASGILVNGNTGGSVTFSGSGDTLSTGANNAVSLTSNTGATINFTGGNLALTTTSGTGFNATGGGTVNVTGTGNTITSTTGTALNIANTTIGASNTTFQSISSNGGSATGIILDTTGSSGGLHVTGTTTAGSGGTIQNKTGADGSTSQGNGIYLNSTQDVQLNHMSLHDFQNDGILGSTVNGFTLANSTITGTNGTNVNTEGAAYFTDLNGTASVTNTTLSGGAADNLSIINSTSGKTLNLTVSGSTISGAGTTGLLLQAGVNAGDAPTINANIDTTNFSGDVARHIQAITNGAGTMAINIGKTGVANSGGSFTGMPAAMIDLDHNSTGNYNFNVQNTTLTVGSTGASVPINIFNGSASGSASIFQGKILNNTITGLNNSGFDGISLTGSGPGTFTALVSNNTITNIAGNGISYTGAQNSATNTTNLTITNNTISMHDPAAAFGIQVSAQASATAHATVNATISGNNVTVDAGADYRVDSRFATGTLLMPGYTGGSQDLTAVKNFVAANNGETAAEINASTGLAPGGTFGNSPGGAATPQPNNSSPLLVNIHAPGSGAPDASAVPLTQDVLATMVDAAIARWAAAGATAADIATMRAVDVTLTSIAGSQIGDATPGHIQIAANAGGYGWFVDATPGSDSEFSGTGSDRIATAGSAAAGRLDLLTTLMHELGHQIGLGDDYVTADSADLMYGYLGAGERRLPQASDIAHRADSTAVMGLLTQAVVHDTGPVHAAWDSMDVALTARSDGMGHAVNSGEMSGLQYFAPQGGPAVASIASLLAGDAADQSASLDHAMATATTAPAATMSSLIETMVHDTSATAPGTLDTMATASAPIAVGQVAMEVTDLHTQLSGGVDLSGLGDIVSTHGVGQAAALSGATPGGPELADGWKVALASTMDFGSDHSLTGLLAHLDQGGTGAAGAAQGMDASSHAEFAMPDMGGAGFAPQIDIRPDAFGHLDHAVL